MVIGIFLMKIMPVFAADDTTTPAVSIFDSPVLFIVSKLIAGYVQSIGKLVMVLVNALIVIASYNNFVDSPAVTEGWVIIRDIVNMFFILILLVIAFGTIFNLSNYRYQAMLPRLLIMAVVINFSRTIIGIFIDFSQVIMLTFVNGFKDAAGANFINALRINELLKFQPNVSSGQTGLEWIYAAYILAALMITITLIVIIAMLMMLVMRIIVLWFLIVLSPLAFFASVWPSGRFKDNYGKWWSTFLDNLTAGPIMAFFLWLSLMVLGSGVIGKNMITESGITAASSEQMPTAAGTAIGTMENMISYIMGIGMLLGTLYMVQSLRSAGGDIAKNALGKIKGYASAGVTKVAMAPIRAGKKAGEWAEEKASFSARETMISGLSKISTVPLIGAVVRKGIGGMRQKQQAESEKYTKYLSGLSPKELEKEAGALNLQAKYAPTAVMNAKRQALELKRLGEVRKMDFNEENFSKVQERMAFLKSRAGLDPKIMETVEEIKKARPDLLLSDEPDSKDPSKPTELKAFADSLDPKEAVKINDKAFGNEKFVSYLMSNRAIQDKILKDGSKIQKEAFRQAKEKLQSQNLGVTERVKRELPNVSEDDFKKMLKDEDDLNYMNDNDISKINASAQTPERLKILMESGRIDPLIKANNINIDNVDFKAENGVIAQKIASSGNEELKQKARAEKRSEYIEGLRSSMEMPGNHAATRKELLGMNENISNIYNIDEKGMFKNEAQERNFMEDISRDGKTVLNIANQLKGEAANLAFETIDMDTLKKYVRTVKTDSEKEQLKQLIDKFIETSQDPAAPGKIKKVANEVQSSPAFMDILESIGKRETENKQEGENKPGEKK